MTITRVPIILEDKVRLNNLTRGLRDKLVKNGYEVIPDGSGYPAVKFQPQDGDVTSNTELVNLLVFLATEKVSFASDYKQTYDPSFTMSHIRDAGLYAGTYLSCAYNGKEWVIEEK